MSKVSKNLPYIWVGTSIYKISEKPLASGDTITVLITWNIETLRRDLTNDQIKQIPRFDGFCCLPSHINHKREISNFYNEYHELSHTIHEGDCSNTLEFIKHIFGEQNELGLDYLQLLYLYPVQMLPVLCLVSRQRGTGKTTFLNWLKAIFEKNCTINTNSDFRSQFTSDWANRLLILVDEVLFDRKEDSERIKHLSTARSFKSEAKGKDRIEIEFFGKFILCSNNENNFIYTDNEEIRFWVRKVPPFAGELEKTLNTLFSNLVSEIPAFLHYLKNRKLSTTKQSRMWFTAEQIETDALRKLKNTNRTKSEKEIANHIIHVMELEELDVIRFTLFDIVNLLSKSGSKIEISEVKTILKDKWEMKHQENSNPYDKYDLAFDGTVSFSKAKGRFYTFNKTFFTKYFDDIDDNRNI